MNTSFQGKEYEIPLSLMERFEHLTKKIQYAKDEDFIELYRGYTIVFNCEFEKYLK